MRPALSEEARLRTFGDRDHGRVSDPSLRGDRIDLLSDRFASTDESHGVSSLDLLIDRRRCRQDIHARRAEDLEQSFVDSAACLEVDGQAQPAADILGPCKMGLSMADAVIGNR